MTNRAATIWYGTSQAATARDGTETPSPIPRAVIWTVAVLVITAVRAHGPFLITDVMTAHARIADALAAGNNWGRQAFCASPEFPPLATFALLVARLVAPLFAAPPELVLTAFAQVWTTAYLIRTLDTGKTRMNCVKLIAQQTHDIGYAHHIQRLMIVGNFCLLAGVEPKQAAKWFLEKYVDAYEWVVLPNVLGMILFADGGYLGTKPYAASANYIGKMSDYCKGCFYRPRKRVGERACPFNFLYWYFLNRNTEDLKNNKRMTMVYNLLRRKSEAEIQMVVKSSEKFLEKIRKHGTDRLKF